MGYPSPRLPLPSKPPSGRHLRGPSAAELLIRGERGRRVDARIIAEVYGFTVALAMFPESAEFFDPDWREAFGVRTMTT